MKKTCSTWMPFFMPNIGQETCFLLNDGSTLLKYNWYPSKKKWKQFLPCINVILYRCFFFKHVFSFTPPPGEMIPFDLRICFKWVREKPPTSHCYVFPKQSHHQLLPRSPGTCGWEALFDVGLGTSTLVLKWGGVFWWNKKKGNIQ